MTFRLWMLAPVVVIVAIVAAIIVLNRRQAPVVQLSPRHPPPIHRVAWRRMLPLRARRLRLSPQARLRRRCPLHRRWPKTP